MPRLRINGTLAPIRTGRHISWDPQKGMTVTEDWVSAGDGLGGLVAQCVANGVPYDHKISGNKSTLSFTAPFNSSGTIDVNTDTWQLLGNEVQKDLREHPNVLAMDAAGKAELEAADPEDEEAVRAAELKTVKGIEQEVEKYNSGEAHDEPTDETALRYFNQRIRGVTSYSLGQYVLKHTTNVSSRYDTNVADSRVEEVYSTEELVEEITDAELWANVCPGRLVAKIDAIPETIESNADLAWGWRKLPSQEHTVSNSRIEISTEYWLAAWSRLAYATNIPVP